MVRQYEYQPCIPTRGTEVPAGPDRFPEIKHDGYRLIVQREGKRVRLLTRRGYDWSDRYPLIAEAALRLRKQSFVIDGEAVVLGPDGISDFEGLHSGTCNEEVRLYAFDLLVDDGVDMRDETLQIRKLWLGKLLKRSGDGIIYNDHDVGAIGPRVKASEQHLQGRSVAALDQGQKPEVARNASRQRRRLVKRTAFLFVAALSLSSCANAPHWLGGLPPDAPPRAGTPEYDAWMAQRAQEAARPKTEQQQPSQSRTTR